MSTCLLSSTTVMTYSSVQMPHSRSLIIKTRTWVHIPKVYARLRVWLVAVGIKCLMLKLHILSVQGWSWGEMGWTWFRSLGKTLARRETWVYTFGCVHVWAYFCTLKKFEQKLSNGSLPYIWIIYMRKACSLWCLLIKWEKMDSGTLTEKFTVFSAR